MTTSDLTFYLPEEQFQSITAESNDFFNNCALSSSCFLPVEDQKQPFHAEDHFQLRYKTYHRIIRTHRQQPSRQGACDQLSSAQIQTQPEDRDPPMQWLQHQVFLIIPARKRPTASGRHYPA